LKLAKVLFEFHSINNAKGYRHLGFYVDNEGNVYSYDYDKSGERWRPQAKDNLTEEVLLSNYAPAKKMIGTVAPDLLWEMFKLIERRVRADILKRRISWLKLKLPRAQITLSRDEGQRILYPKLST
jgi:hypothetical protein